MDKQQEAELKKKLNKLAQDGFKLGQTISGMYKDTMNPNHPEKEGNCFFNLCPLDCDGDLSLMEKVLEGMHKDQSKSKSPPLKFPYHLGKMLLSAGDDRLSVIVHVPDCLLDKLKPVDWIEIVKPLNGIIIETSTNMAKAYIPADQVNNRYPLKDRDILSNASFALLRSKNLMNDPESDDEPDYVGMAQEAGIEW